MPNESMNDLDYFANDYFTARERYLKLAADCRPPGVLRAFRVPTDLAVQLHVDYLYIPARKQKKTLFVFLSGVHGVEGYTGSAIQQMLLNEMAAELHGEDHGCFFIHALNPFGFLQNRRVTENNVNLNRNFSLDEAMFRSPNPGYAALASKLNPLSQAIVPELSFGLTLLKTLSVILKKGGAQNLTQSIGQGQFEFPEGIEFGGRKREPQINDFVEELQNRMTEYSEILFFDLHTGLGDRGVLHLIPCEEERGVNADLLKKYLQPENETEIYQYTPTGEEGFYKTIGDSNRLFANMLKPHQKGLAFTVEFGTLGGGGLARLDSLNRLIVENQGYHQGYAGVATERRTKKLFEEMFIPHDPEWRKEVIRRARALFRNVLARKSN